MLTKSDLPKRRPSKEGELQSLLPHILQVFERIIYKQITNYIENKLSNYITGCRKSHGTQHSLITMLEKWKSALDKDENVCILFMDLSKAFNTINHDLLLAKLKAQVR